MHANFYNIMPCNILGSLHISMHSDNWTPTLRALDEKLEMLLASRVNEMHALLGDLLVSNIQLSLLCNFCCFYEDAMCRSLKVLVGSQRCAHKPALLASSTRTIRCDPMPDPHTRHVAHLLHNACMRRVWGCGGGRGPLRRSAINHLAGFSPGGRQCLMASLSAGDGDCVCY